MNDERNERLSVMIDGELKEQGSDQVIAHAKSDKELYDTVARYYLIGDAMRNSLPDEISLGLADKVRQSIAKEPTVLAPGRQRTTSFKRFAAGFSIAASVAAIAFLSVQQNGAGPKQEITVAERASSPVEIPTLEPQSTPSTVEQGSVLPITPRLNSYLVNHSRYRSHISVQGVAPYARVVGYETNR